MIDDYYFRLGYVAFEEYMSFMISRETDNIQSLAEIDEAFSAISNERDKLYVTKEELTQVSVKTPFHYLSLSLS